LKTADFAYYKKHFNCGGAMKNIKIKEVMTPINEYINICEN
jgi:hypothetical protein